MDNLDLPRPEVEGGIYHKFRQDLDTLIAKGKETKPEGKNFRFSNDEDDPSLWKELVIYPENPRDPTKAFDKDLQGLDWTNDNFAHSITLKIEKSYDFPNLYQGKDGNIYSGDSTYYIDNKGNAIKTANFHQAAPHVVKELQERGAYSPNFPLHPLPEISAQKTTTGWTYGHRISKLDGGDQELLGMSIAQAKNGAWKPV